MQNGGFGNFFHTIYALYMLFAQKPGAISFLWKIQNQFLSVRGKRIPTPVTRSLARNDSASRCSGGQSRSPLRTLSLRGAKRRGNPFPFSEGRIPTPVTRSLAWNDMGGVMWAPSPTKMTTLSGGHFLLFCALVSEPARPRWGCWRPETRRCRCAWWWRRPC